MVIKGQFNQQKLDFMRLVAVESLNTATLFPSEFVVVLSKNDLSIFDGIVSNLAVLHFGASWGGLHVHMCIYAQPSKLLLSSIILLIMNFSSFLLNF